jgi:hypothetical protein
MISFLLWNVHKNNIPQHIKNIALANDVDVLILLESNVQQSVLLGLLNDKNDNKYFYNPNAVCTKAEVYTRFPGSLTEIIKEDNRTTIRHVSIPGASSFLLAISHFHDKRSWTADDQSSVCNELQDLITSAEKVVKHSRTVLIGDLNMNPFEAGVVGSLGLHGVSSRKIALTGNRVVNNKARPFFYNPTWNLFGDSKGYPPGTYYFSKSRPIEYFWNIFDQVLIRPDLINFFNVADLRIITTNGQGVQLIKRNGIPNQRLFSDHLPLFFTLSI